MANLLKRMLRPALRLPLVRSVAKALSGRLGDLLVRCAVAPRVHLAPAAATHRSDDLIANTDAFNLAAEAYFADYPDLDFIIEKPFSDQANYPRYLFNLGVLFHWLRIAPGDVVAELGAGTCWVSHFLNLYGCRTVSIDISATAMELGRKLFERDSRTRWELEPRFLAYDGYRFPIEDESCDRMVVHDAFHHIPNQRVVLEEMARVLRPGGLVAMLEPGRSHSQTSASQKEMRETAVLENDIVVEDLAELARDCGFTRTTVVPITLLGTQEVDAAGLTGLFRGRGLLDFWETQTRELMLSHYILMYKGPFTPDSRHPGVLKAGFDFPGRSQPLSWVVSVGERLELRCNVTNTGNAVWLPEAEGDRGMTKLGVHLMGERGENVDFNWHREPIRDRLLPGETASLDLLLPPVETPGRYNLVFDMVAEYVMWFAERGSPVAEASLEVRP